MEHIEKKEALFVMGEADFQKLFDMIATTPLPWNFSNSLITHLQKSFKKVVEEPLPSNEAKNIPELEVI